MEVKYTKELAWKDHNIDLDAVNVWAKANCGEQYCGASADSAFKMHFMEEPSQEIKDAIDELWEDLDDEEHEMCASYKSKEERAEEVAAKKASGKAKLIALGLTEDEAAALVG